MAGRLEGKVCIITGTGGAIRRASALMFTREGARVVGYVSEESGFANASDIVADGGITAWG